MRGSLGGDNGGMTLQIAPPPQWEPVITQWLDSLRAQGLAQSTVKLRSYQLRRFTVWLATEHHGTELAAADVAVLQDWLATDGWSASTRKSARAAVRSFYHWLHYTGQIADDPSLKLRPIRVPIGKPRPAGELAVKHGMKHPDKRVPLMVKLAAMQGLRAVEICQVHTDDITEDLLGYSLRVRGKGGRVRVIPLNDQIARELLAHDPGYIFPGRIDGHLSPSYVSKLLSRALPHGITGHMLRHRAAGHFYHGTGYDLRATQELLGHASPATTQIYTPAIPDQMRKGIIAAAG